MRLNDLYLLVLLLKMVCDGRTPPPELLAACRRVVGREFAILDARRELIRLRRLNGSR